MEAFSPEWRSPPVALALTTGLDIWRASLDVTPVKSRRYEQALSAAERERAERFRLQVDRDRFVAAHGILRALIARYLDTSPDSIRFKYGPYGKPAVDEDLCFNLSHSQALAVYVFSPVAVGIDLEFIRADVPVQELVERFFSPEEKEAFFAVPLAERQEHFFLQWTRREAYVKASGSSISMSPDELEQTGKPDWSLVQFTPADGYAAAVVVRGQAGQPSYWQWEE